MLAEVKEYYAQARAAVDGVVRAVTVLLGQGAEGAELDRFTAGLEHVRARMAAFESIARSAMASDQKMGLDVPLKLELTGDLAEIVDALGRMAGDLQRWLSASVGALVAGARRKRLIEEFESLRWEEFEKLTATR